MLLKRIAARGHLRTERRAALMRRQDYHDGAHLDPLVEVDDVLVGHTDAARGNRLTDIFRLVGAVDTIEGVLVAVEQIHGARTHWALRARTDKRRHVHALPLAGGRRPRRPFRHALDFGHA